MCKDKITKIMMATRSSMPPIEEYIEEIRPLWNSHWLSNDGTIHSKFESKLKEYLDVENIALFVNGHMALELALSGMNLKGEVITTPFTYIATANAIVRNGLKPVFCDIREDDFNIDVDKIESLITEKTSAIVPVHIYGSPCDVEAIDKLAQKYGLKVIYDAAQSFGVTIDGNSIANYGDASMFSFHATKSFHSVEGGAVVYSDKRWRDILFKVGNFGTIQSEELEWVYPNAKMNEFQAAMGVCNLNHIDEEIAKRKRISDRYREGLSDVAGIKMVPERRGVRGNYTYMPMTMDPEAFGLSRKELLQKLKDENVFAGTFFEPLIVDFDYYKTRYREADIPVARKVAESIIVLPMFADMEEEDVDKVCRIIKDNYKG